MTTVLDANAEESAKKSRVQLDPKVQYETIRGWIRNEEQLIATRIGWFLASEAFMFTGYAISASKTPASLTSFVLTILLPIFGMYLAWRIMYPVGLAVQTIDLWIEKERAFLKKFPSFKVLGMAGREDSAHWRSWQFPRELAWSVGLFSHPDYTSAIGSQINR